MTANNGKAARVLGWPPNFVFAMMCGAAVLCCIPMAMPQGHLVAFCSDLGISRSMGAMMLSVLLGTAFLSRQIWGAISDRIGGVATVLIGSAWQTASMTAFLFTQNETGLFTIRRSVRSRLFRDYPCLCVGAARAVSCFGGFVANPDAVVVQRLRNGRWRLACRTALRPLRLITRRPSPRHRRQYRQSVRDRDTRRTQVPKVGGRAGPMTP